jgi:hypothetical protein
LVLAQAEARLANHNYLGIKHILVGLIHEGDSEAANVLESLGVSLKGVRAKGRTGSAVIFVADFRWQNCLPREYLVRIDYLSNLLARLAAGASISGPGRGREGGKPRGMAERAATWSKFGPRVCWTLLKLCSALSGVTNCCLSLRVKLQRGDQSLDQVERV